MTLEEKIGQLIQADIASIQPEDLHNYPLGSILAGGNAAPGGDVRAPAASWLALMQQFHRESRSRSSTPHLAIPVLIGIDAVHGHARIPGATVFPHNVGLGATHDVALVERIGEATAAEVSATGIDWTFGPTVAVARDVRWGRSYESYSEDPKLVSDMARAMIVGLQGRPRTNEFMAPGRVLASIKHFLGDGGTIDGRDQFDSRVDELVLRDVHGAPYSAALSAGTLIVMASYNSWRGAKMHANPSLLTGVLKDRWSFPGFVVGDWNAQEEIPGCTKFSCAAVLSAGLDMYMAPDGWKRLYANLLAQAHEGRVPISRVDDAVRRILRVKAISGLLTTGSPGERSAAGVTSIGNDAHRHLARDAVRKSLVLLKNDGGVLPLDANTHILVAGAAADDIGMQCGGWTVDWQGDHNTNADFPGATSIYAGIKASVERAGGTVELSNSGAFKHRPAAAIVVYGEGPYAEFQGDRETLEFAPGGGPHLEILRRLRRLKIPVVSVFLSGRVMWVNRELNASDAFVAAWLPGTEGGGIADLLLKPPEGSARPDFTGRLAFSWPATAMPVTFDSGSVPHGALFARGYGLTLSSRETFPPLSENPSAAPDRGSKETLFTSGHVTAPWSIYVADATAEVRLTMASQTSPEHAVTATLDASAVHASWGGSGKSEFRIGGRAATYVASAQGGLELAVRYRVDDPPAQAVRVGVRCDAPYGAHDASGADGAQDWKLCGQAGGAVFDVTSTLRAAPLGAWRALRIPLECLAKSGADLSNVSSPFAIETSGRFQLSIADVRFVRATAVPDCQRVFK